eukprot:14426275-Ditylum_brightwellii.AAC.1
MGSTYHHTFEQKFHSDRHNNIQRSDFFHTSFSPDAACHQKQFKAFFALQDPGKAASTCKKGPNWKIK